MKSERETLTLVNPTPNTIICDQAALKRASNFLYDLLDENSDTWGLEDFLGKIDDYKAITDPSGDFADYADSITELQHNDVKPYLAELLANTIHDYNALKQYIDTDHHAYTEEYLKSAEYASDYFYLANEGQWEEKALNQAIIEHLQAKYTGYWQLLDNTEGRPTPSKSITDSDLFQGFKQYLKHMVGYEHDTSDGYFDTYANDFIAVDSFPVGEHEDQVEISCLTQRLALKSSQSDIIKILDALGETVLSRDSDYPYFYIHTNTEITHHYGWWTETLTNTLDEYLANPDNVAPDTLNRPITVTNPYSETTHTETTGSCSCCGHSPNAYKPHRHDDDPTPLDIFRIFRAQFADSDGVYYSRLCGDLLGNGCIYDVVPQPSAYTDTINELSGDDLDGAQSDYEDFIGLRPTIDGIDENE